MLEDPDRNWDCCVNWYEAPEQEQLAEYYCGAVDSTSNNKLEGFLERRAAALLVAIADAKGAPMPAIDDDRRG
jgi:hypothetical protein